VLIFSYWRAEGVKYLGVSANQGRASMTIFVLGAGYFITSAETEQCSSPNNYTPSGQSGISVVEETQSSSFRGSVEALPGFFGVHWESDHSIVPMGSAAEGPVHPTLSMSFSVLAIHLAYPFAATAAWPLISTIQYLRHRNRPKEGHCPTCGYDLRATPDRCPECGNQRVR
jgi:hypothetical protein